MTSWSQNNSPEDAWFSAMEQDRQFFVDTTHPILRHDNLLLTDPVLRPHLGDCKDRTNQLVGQQA